MRGLPRWTSPAEDLELERRLAAARERARRIAHHSPRVEALDAARPRWVPHWLWNRLMIRAYIRAVGADFVDAIRRARGDWLT